jgi:hypothetical protein
MITSPLTVVDKTVNDNVIPFIEKTVVPFVQDTMKSIPTPSFDMPSFNVKPLIADTMFVQYAKPVAKRSWKVSGQAIDFVAARSPKFVCDQMGSAFSTAKTWFDANVIEIERTVKPAAVKPVTAKAVKNVATKPVAKNVANKTVGNKTVGNKTVAKKTVGKKTVTKTVAAKSA